MRALLTLWTALVLMTVPAIGQTVANGIGLTRAVQIAETKVAGRVVDAELEMDGPRAVYEVEIAAGGRLHIVAIDATTGRHNTTTVRKWRSLLGRWIGEEKLKPVHPAKPLSGMLAALERDTHGKVREVSLETGRGTAWYEVEIATRAGVTKVNLDPVSGERLAMVYDD